MIAVSCLAALGCAAEKPVKPAARSDAEQIACEQVPGGFVTSLRQEIDLGRLVYKVVVQNDSTAKRVSIDAATGRILEVIDRTEELREAMADNENLTVPLSLTVRAAAESTALAAVPGELLRWRVFKDGERLLYRCGIAQANGQVARVTIDTGTGAVLSIARPQPAR
ncbi:MAG: PepSY domain-containing protein [candidate division KSB1 bacterium]|nr:PepSY domain-containing protein [candidate division KSB1 bacterium]MDZ7272582.1 PepSY domain-containing protein [candidate division KSB1 bacterium]MDZ7284395.1 PepSY domain-containing protein [candidate division KSB1 bacterium]MDZ7297209.1 PepSY domain-containing protein [candidate division KSB1 bacterium]MDZ7309315.1 PepSY domain-containing protein [candidate division KSB1 bacterium]